MQNRLMAAWMLLPLLFAQVAFPCTGVLVSSTNGFTVAKSFDWDKALVVAYLNTKYREKTALRARGVENPMVWQAEYGSLTFSQFGPEFHMGGMNEAGLVVEILLLPGHTQYPNVPGAKELNELQWIQYILDTSATTKEAITNAKHVQIKKIYADVHYFVCDLQKECTVFEFLNGELKEPKILEASHRVLTNDPYEKNFLESFNYIPFGGSQPIDENDMSSEMRFARAAALAKSLGADTNRSSSESARVVLDSVKATHTKWQIVYSPKNKTAEFKLVPTGATTEISLASRDFDCNNELVLYHDISGDISGEPDSDVPRRFEVNDVVMTEEILKKGSKEYGNLLSPGEINYIANYTQNFPCHQQKRKQP